MYILNTLDFLMKANKEHPATARSPLTEGATRPDGSPWRATGVCGKQLLFREPKYA